MIPERIFIQTLIGRVLADDIYMGKKNRVIFFTIYPLTIETLKVLEKLIKK